MSPRSPLYPRPVLLRNFYWCPMAEDGETQETWEISRSLSRQNMLSQVSQAGNGPRKLSTSLLPEVAICGAKSERTLHNQTQPQKRRKHRAEAIRGRRKGFYEQENKPYDTV